MLTYSTPEELRQVIVRMLVICAFVAVACIGLPLFLGAWDKGVLVDFLKETLQAST